MLWPHKLVESDTLDPWSQKRSTGQDAAWGFACTNLSWLPEPSEHLTSHMLLCCQLPQHSTSPARFQLPPRLSLGMGGGSFRNSPKLTSLRSLPHQHDSPKNHTGVLRLLADMLPKPVSLVSLAASQSPRFIYLLSHVLCHGLFGIGIAFSSS